MHRTHCERGGLGLGLWGFSDYLLLLSGAEAGEAGCAPFPQAVGGAAMVPARPAAPV